jgi:hypothetical protein
MLDSAHYALAMLQKDFSHKTQREQILALFIGAHGDWVPPLKTVGCAPHHDACIYELRRPGFHIGNRTQDVNSVRHSWFRLKLGSHAPAAPAKSLPETLPVVEPAGSSEHWAAPEEC